MARYLYSKLASAIQARKNCIQSKNKEWKYRHEDWIDYLVKNCLPSGSGIDCGTIVNLEASHGEKLVLETSFHHMHESGVYDGWTEHTITVTPSFSGGFHLRISGRNRNDIKELLHEEYSCALAQDISLEWWQYHFEAVPIWKHDYVDCRNTFTVICGNTPIATCGTLNEMRAFIVRWCEGNKASLKPRGL